PPLRDSRGGLPSSHSSHFGLRTSGRARIQESTVQPSRLPLLETLEERCLLSTSGIPWPDGSQLTLSFAPDGTSAATPPSALFHTLAAVAPTWNQEREIARAFQTWAVAANLNFGLVGDQGQPFGTAGRPQGDDRFGDIRIGAEAFVQNDL